MPQQGCGAFRELAIKGPLKDVFNEIISGWYSELFTAPPDPLFVHLKSSNSLTLDDNQAVNLKRSKQARKPFTNQQERHGKGNAQELESK